MVTPPDIEAQILRYYHAERWTTGTIAQQLHVHHGVVRRVFWHPAFRKPSEGGLFVFLISEARWQDGWERTARGSVALKRGQVLICEAELAELWDFHRNKLRRMLRSMADHRIITMGPLRHGDIQGTLITILNYDKYQYGGGADPVGLKGTGTAPGPRRDHALRKFGLRTGDFRPKVQRIKGRKGIKPEGFAFWTAGAAE